MRPEGIMAADDGTIFTADARGCCSRTSSEGETAFFGALGGVPNGICLDREGNCIVANIGNGQVQSLAPDGSHTVLMTEAEGKPMPTPNFPFIDSRGRLWVSNSTAHCNVQDALDRVVPDGSLVVIEDGIPRIAADGICFANGVAVDAEERYVYVAESTTRRIVRYAISPGGSLGPMEIYGPDSLGSLGYPDGIALDEGGNLWITFPVWNAIGLINPQRKLEIVLEDSERKILRAPTNICFGWDKRKTAFIGSLQGSTIPYFEIPYPGVRLIHQGN
jgi:gluconolactonase